jgi:serine/threonine protein kinase
MQSDPNKAGLTSVQVRSLMEAHLGHSMRIVEVLGSNGVDYLIRAYHLELEDDVFVRVFAADPETSPRAFRSFVEMADATAALDHPNIATGRPLQRHDQLAYFIIPTAGARSLESQLATEQLLPLDRSLAILREIASALDYAHERGLVHARLDPSAIRIRENGSPVVTGFGAGSGIPVSRSGRSSAYMAPEQWEAHAAVDSRADIYALGVIAFEMISGRRRAIALSADGIAIVDPLPVTHDVALRQGVGLNVNEALLRAVAKRPELRFKTAGELVVMLEGRSQAPVQGLPTQRPVLDMENASHFALIPILVVIGLGIALGVTAAPMARQALRKPGDFSSITDGINLRSSISTASGSVASGAPSSSRPLSGNSTKSSNPSSSRGLFPGAATAAGGGAAGPATRAPSAPTPASTSPSQSSSATASTTTAGAPTSAPASNDQSRASAAIPVSDSTGFVRVELVGASALVLIDGVPRGASPYVGPLRAGTHSVSVVSTASVQPSNRQIVIHQGDTTIASFSVAPAAP